MKNNKWDRSIFQDKSPGYDVAKQMTHFSQSNFIFYHPEEELQKACVLLAEECRPLGSTVHCLASFIGMLLAGIPTVCIFSAPLFLDLSRYFDTFFMEDLGSLFHRRVLGNRYSSSGKFGGFEY